MKNMIEFYRNNVKLIIIFATSAMLLYGCRVFDATIGLDTEATIEKSANYKEWMQMGRQGLYCLKYMLHLDDFNPFYSGVTSFVALLGVMIVWSYALYAVYSKIKPIQLSVFGVLMIANPIWAEQFYFKCQITEILIGIVLIGISVLLSWKIINKFSVYLLMLNIGLLTFSFSVYQALEPLYITGIALTYVLYVYNLWTYKKNTDCLLKIGLVQVGIFFGVFIANTIITKIFFSGRSYLNDTMVGWGNMSTKDCVENILRYVKAVVLGEKIFANWVFSASVILLAVILFLRMLGEKGKGKFYFGIGVVMTWASVFFMAIILGKEPLVRSQFSLPFVIAFNFLLFLIVLNDIGWNKIYYRYAAVIVIVVVMMVQSCNLLRLFYTDYIRNEEDKTLAKNISARIDEKIENNSDAQVVIIGAYKNNLNSACIQGEMIGSESMFGFCALYPEVNYSSTLRSLFFMNSLGMNYTIPSIENVRKARDWAMQMPSWPAEDSVRYQDNIVVVKLSDEFDAYSLLDGEVNKINVNLKADNSNYKYNIDSVQIVDGDIKIVGWGVVRYQSNTFSNKILLRNKKNGAWYGAQTVCDERRELTDALNDQPCNYNKAGFVSRININQLNLDDNTYEIYISNNMKGGWKLVKTGRELSKKSIK